ncbi:type II toxin-antitoxin system RelE/ParE family toxin [Methylocystis heyeri]|uniref:Type II toxin-antitoxin system RelE/ParE family toxin n=1 Tax=Methylocystis heyeri TaxID=391905 RepID=A0A6B8KDG7_9HYPH|nr:type II toxin-antitoxin system RelE/ParE family toxin [Methylocystis heyeri]QGM45065.1 type II toxin-antitoxin system RelE/ParE family toxin [Methylocystis heyeri]
MRTPIFLNAALRDLDDIFEYLAEQSGDLALAREFVDSIVEQVEKMAALPGTIGRPRDNLAKGLRSFPFRGYLIFMRYEKDRLYVVDVLHQRRDVESAFVKDTFPK